MRRNLAAVAFGLVVAVLLSELFLRLVTPKRQEAFMFNLREFVRFDPWLGWSGRPGATGVLVRQDAYKTTVCLNSRGLRDRERGPKVGTRVLCLGDSFTWGLGVESRETWPAVLGDETGVETINAGVCGWGTAQELLWLRREGFGYDPDAVVLGFFLNDFADNAAGSARGYPRPVYALEGGRLVLRGAPIPEESAAATALNHMATVRLLMAGWEWFERGFLRGPDAAPVTRARLRDNGPVQAPLAEAETGAILAEAKRLCEERGIRFLVLAIPSVCQVREMTSRACREQDWVLYASLVRLCTASGVTVVKPIAALRATEAAGRPTYSQSDMHWNAAGHRIAAHAVAAALLPTGNR